MNRDFLFSSIRNKLPGTKSTECNNRMQELYWFTKSFTSGKEAQYGNISNHINSMTRRKRKPESNLFLDYTLCIYKHKCEKMDTNHSILPPKC